MTTSEETRDGFLGGRLTISQPRFGYRAGVDPVLLAAATPAKPNQRVLDIGCGVGTAAFCLGARVSGLQLSGLEVQPAYAALARRNAGTNGIAFEVFEGDLANPPAALNEMSFDHVITNPPYYRRERSTASPHEGRDIALAGSTSLETWIDFATRRLLPKGYLTLIQRADRLADVLRAMDLRVGSIRIRPISARIGRAAELVIVQARKGGRADLVLEAPFIMHDGTHHDSDRDDYTIEARSILRNGAPLEWSS
ncbi:tRNA1(Val) (adenine(37)-N6)-methyltransferase [Celeribacter arenosi]|uniref:Methyltransferase n=1 Tax=Celeribacter arenosi TaxID=792649 RepID=A0ABP7K0V2_9RHOB